MSTDIIVSSFVAVAASRPEYGYESSYVFYIPDLVANTPSLVSSFFTAPLFNRGPAAGGLRDGNPPFRGGDG